MRKIITGILFLITGVATPAKTQDFKAVFSEMKERHEQMKRFHMIMQVEARDNEKAKAFYSERIEMKKDEDNFLYQVSSNCVLLSDKHLIEVDKANHSMVVNKRDSKAEGSFRRHVQFNVDSMLSFYETPVYKGEKDGIYRYKLFQKNGEIKTIELDVNKTSGLLARIEYRYHADQVVTIVFDLFDTEPVFKPGTFDEENFIVQAKGVLKPAADYKDFQIIRPDTK